VGLLALEELLLRVLSTAGVSHIELNRDSKFFSTMRTRFIFTLHIIKATVFGQVLA
jgi:hypothetical protein